MLMPDSAEEARLLVKLLDLSLYPVCRKSAHSGPDYPSLVEMDAGRVEVT